MCRGGRAGSACWWWGDTVTCVWQRGRRLSDRGEFRAGGQKYKAAAVSLFPLRSLLLPFQLVQIRLLCLPPSPREFPKGWRKTNYFLSSSVCLSAAMHQALDTLSDSTSSTTANDLDLIFLKGIMESPVVRGNGNYKLRIFFVNFLFFWIVCLDVREKRNEGHSAILTEQDSLTQSRRANCEVTQTTSLRSKSVFYACKFMHPDCIILNSKSYYVLILKFHNVALIAASFSFFLFLFS